jgi:hypothetical protein
MQLDRVNLGKAVAETDFEKNLEKSFQRLVDQLFQLFRNGLLFSDNFDCDIVDFTTPAIRDTEFSVAHDLKRVPTGYIVIRSTNLGPALLYDGPTAWTTTSIYLKEPYTGGIVGKLMIF